MSLNLAQIEAQVKQGPRPKPNAANPAGEAMLMSDLYRALKAAGWASTGTVHAADRVSLLSLDNAATIRRDKTQAPGSWLIEVAGGQLRLAGDAESVTAKVRTILAELTDDQAPAVVSPAALVAAGIEAEYPQLKSRLAAAVELIETGKLDLAKYDTCWDNAGFYGCWSCSCPDQLHRGEALRSKWGAGCKHALAGLIQQMLEKEQKAVAYRKLASDVERRAARSIERGDYASPAQYRPACDPLNVHAYRPNFQRVVQYGR